MNTDLRSSYRLAVLDLGFKVCFVFLLGPVYLCGKLVFCVCVGLFSLCCFLVAGTSAINRLERLVPK